MSDSPAALFDLLWENVADVLGTAATATLMRRSIRRAMVRTAWPEPVVVVRAGLEYGYRVPDSWTRPDNDAAIAMLRAVAAELRVLLVELTGPVVVTRLGRLAPLLKWGIDFDD